MRAVLHHGAIPRELWGEILAGGLFVEPRASQSERRVETPHEQSPEEADIHHLRALWAKAYTHIAKPSDKLQQRAFIRRLVGYDSDSIYRIYDPS